MSNPNGGHASPTQCRTVADDAISLEYRGMTLRDYFAAKAMQCKLGPGGSSVSYQEMARRCYALADAMLAEREK